MVLLSDNILPKTEVPHPDKIYEVLSRQIRRSRSHLALERLHAACKAHFDAGRRDFHRSLIIKAANIQYTVLRKPIYEKLFQAWAAYALQNPLMMAEAGEKTPEAIYLDTLNSITRRDGRETLTLIHVACAQLFDERQFDITRILVAEKSGVPYKRLTLNPAYERVIDAWRAYCEQYLLAKFCDVAAQTPEAALAKARQMLIKKEAKQRAEKIYEKCKELCAQDKVDFNYTEIAKACGLVNGASLAATEPYKEIVEAWHNFAKVKFHGVAISADPYRALLDEAIGEGQISTSTRMKLEHIHEMLRVQHESGLREFDGVQIASRVKLAAGTLTAASLRYSKLIQAWERTVGKRTFYQIATSNGKLLGADETFDYLLRIDRGFQTWKEYAVEWIGTLQQTQDTPIKALQKFFYNYIHKLGLTKNPGEFLSKGYIAPCFYQNCLAQLKRISTVTTYHSTVERFLLFVLTRYFSEELPSGARIVPSQYCSPVPPLPDSVRFSHEGPLDESDKLVLPYLFILKLREILCPEGAANFGDWTWAHDAVPMSNSGAGGDWFIVEPDFVDVDDPDCVYRTRTDADGNLIYEMWSPARAVALFIKLELPLRLFQIRFLDSGEADTYRYKKGEWSLNLGKLAKGSKKQPFRLGVFRRMQSDIGKSVMTGLYVNTNKNADRMKSVLTRGYEVPWEHKKVLYWLEKLRDWQEKYNPIDQPMPWTKLNKNHFGSRKPPGEKLRGGETCFLFRNAAGIGIERQMPLASRAPVNTLWIKLLLTLEKRLCDAGELSANGKKFVFVEPDGREDTPIYSLQGLRVSLITAFALEGGVSMPILSKCIAGHSRLVMTLYYTKAGVQHVTDVMEKASQRMFSDAKGTFLRWLKDATYPQLEAKGAFVDPAAIQAVIAAQGNGASLVRDDKGLCPKGGLGCDSGGIYRNDDTGTVEYGPVPGYPQKNCPRCRWFFTGPAFLDGLQNHWNIIHLQMGDNGDKVKELAERVGVLQDERYECQSENRVFPEQPELDTLTKAYEDAVSKNDKLAQDQHATLRLIDRCKALANMREGDGLSLISAGDISDVRFAIKECGKFQQILNAVQISRVYPEHDVAKAILEAGRAYDMMLSRNGKQPVLFRLSDSEQKSVVQQITMLLRAYSGSTEGAVDFIEGRRRLSELGFDFSEEGISRLARNEEPIVFECAKPKNMLLLASSDDADEELEDAE